MTTRAGTSAALALLLASWCSLPVHAEVRFVPLANASSGNRLYVADTEAECPTTGAANGDVCIALDTGKVIKRAAGSNVAAVAFGSLTGSAACAQLPPYTGDVTTPPGSCATTLAAGSASNLNSGTLAIARGGTGNASGAQTYVFFATTTAPACGNGGGTTTFLGPSGAGSATETSVVRFVVPLAGTARNLRAWLGANVPSGETAAIKIALNGAAQANPTCSVSAGAAVCNDTSGHAGGRRRRYDQRADHVHDSRVT